MDQLEELKEEVGRMGRLLDAGNRGATVGGDLLLAFGAIFSVFCGITAASAFGYLPLMWAPSPLAASTAFLSIATVFDGTRDGMLRAVPFALVAALAGEAAWRGTVMLFQPSEMAHGMRVGATLLAISLLLVIAGTLVGLWRLSRNALSASPANRTLIGVWTGIAGAMAVAIALCVAAGIRTGNWFGLNFVPSFFWVLWGAGWWASATTTNSRWMRIVAAGSWALAVYTAASFDFYATSIIGFAALAVAPGIWLLREAHRTHEA